MRPFNILMISNHFYPGQGGMERQAQRLASQLITLGNRVEMLTPRYRGLTEREEIQDIRISRFFILRCPHYPYRLLSKLVYALSLLKLIFKKQKEFDIFHVHQALFAAFVSVIAAMLTHKKVIIKVTGSGINGNMSVLKNFLGGKLMLRVIKMADAFISLSPDTTKELLDNNFPPEKIIEIPNGVPVDEFTVDKHKVELRKELNIREDVFSFIYAGRLNRDKNLASVLHTWKRFHDQKANTLLLMAGDGPERSNLEKIARDTGITDSVIFLGHVDNVAEVLAASDCFVLNSRSEGMSNALLEAMTVGLPCIVSNNLGNMNVIQDNENGLVFDVDKSEEAITAMTRVVTNPHLDDRLSQNAKITIATRYSMEAVANEYCKIYERLLHRPQNPLYDNSVSQ
jgi:glycosyltransferase involved in cell wall biosynthesis